MYFDKGIYCKPKDCAIVHFVGDRYNTEPSVSLKQEEIEKRGQYGSSITKESEPHDTLKIPIRDLNSQNKRNKANLLDYICNSWMKNYARLPADLNVVIGGVGKAFEITQSG